jgi:hypothetical protein
MEYRTEIEAAIDEFRRCLRPDFPPLKIEHAFDVVNLEVGWKFGVKRGAWQDRGVYLVFDDDAKLIYVGKATATFNKRIKRCAEMENAASVEIIPFPEPYEFLAHALEAFLIVRLRPIANKHGSNDYIPMLPPCTGIL